MSENKNEIPGISPSSIKMDLVRFKNEILKDMRNIQLSLDDKYLKADDFLKERITQFELKINTFNTKLTEISNLILNSNSVNEKIESLEQFREEIKDLIFKRRAKLNDFQTKTEKEISQINDILLSSIIYPSLIGKTAKFQTFHDFMDYVVKQLAQLIIFKEKNFLDLTPYKKKIDQTLDAFRTQIKNFSSKDYIENKINLTKDQMNNLLKSYDNRLEETRIENSKNLVDLQNKTEELNNQIKIFKKNFVTKLEYKSSNFNDNDIIFIKTSLIKINETIKELLSYHPSTQKKFIHEFEKKSSKVYSGVKQYIKGNLNADELSSMKKFTFEKSKTKIFDKSIPSSSKSPFHYPESSKNLNKIIDQKINSHNLNKDQLLFINNNYISNSKEKSNTVDKRKVFKTQKTLNDSNHLRKKNYDLKLNQIYSNNNEYNDILDYQRNMRFRKKTFHTNFDNYKNESSKLNFEKKKKNKRN